MLPLYICKGKKETRKKGKKERGKIFLPWKIFFREKIISFLKVFFREYAAIVLVKGEKT